MSIFTFDHLFFHSFAANYAASKNQKNWSILENRIKDLIKKSHVDFTRDAKVLTSSESV